MLPTCTDPTPLIPDPLQGYVSPLPKLVVTPEQARRPATPEEVAERRVRYRKLAELLEQWATEDPEYDEYAGAILEEELKKGRGGYEQADEPAA